MTKAARSERVLGYVRVSTQSQADNGIGFDYQKINRAEHYRGLGADLVETYNDAEMSGTSGDCPGLKAMFVKALRPGSGITEIGVYSLCRLFRDPDLLEHHRRKLKRAGVHLVAIPQEVGQDADGDLVRTTGRLS